MIKIKKGYRQKKGGGLLKRMGKRIIYKNGKEYKKIVSSIDMEYLLKDGNRLGMRKTQYLRELYDIEMVNRIRSAKNGEFLNLDEIENQENIKKDK